MKTPPSRLPSFCLIFAGIIVIMVGALRRDDIIWIVGLWTLLVGLCLSAHVDYLIWRGGRD